MWTKCFTRRAQLFGGVFFVATMTACLISAGEIADLHRKWVRPKEVDPAPLMARFQRFDHPNHGVTEIGMERTPCFGTCRVYTVILRSDGSVQYTGEENVRRKGKHAGRISDWAFNQLAEYLVESGYMEMESNYEVAVTDLPTAFTTAVVNGKRKIIRNYGDVGPSKLWALQQAIDGVLIEAEWDGEPKRDGETPAKGQP
ncbi:MAG: hypothetical protein HQ518_31865 [Rhodopirellula sp.]|nr:hypothetical protein [Rhodopirellula sp.]